MQLDSQQRHWIVPASFEVAVEGHRPRIHDRHRSRTDDFELFAANDHCGVLVDPNAEMVWVSRNRREKPSNPSPLRKMLVDDDARDEIESGSDLDDARPRTDQRLSAENHCSRHRRRSGAGAAKDCAGGVKPSQGDVRRRAAQKRCNSPLVTTCEKNSRRSLDLFGGPMGFIARLDVHNLHGSGAQLLKGREIRRSSDMWLIGSDGQHDDSSFLPPCQSEKRAQNCAVTLLFFRAPNDDKGTGVGICFHRPESHCHSKGDRSNSSAVDGRESGERGRIQELIR